MTDSINVLVDLPTAQALLEKFGGVVMINVGHYSRGLFEWCCALVAEQHDDDTETWRTAAQQALEIARKTGRQRHAADALLVLSRAPQS